MVGEQGLKQGLRQAGLQVVNPLSEDEERAEGNSMSSDEIGSMEVDPKVKAVVCGINYSFNYRKLCKASLYI